MLNSGTDEDWEWYGKNDPYYGVVSWDIHRKHQFDETAKEAFFRGGEEYVAKLGERISGYVGSGFSPGRVLDFGCGVGRIALPLARRYPEVVGADISPSMLEHARLNCREMGIDNATFVDSRDLDRSPEQYDLVHSFIVLQHIPVARGYGISRSLIGRISPGGVGVLHFTYRHHSARHLRGKLMMRLYRSVPFAYRIRRVLKREPVMQMNEYDMNIVLSQIQDAGCGGVQIRFTDHGCRGAILMFQKADADSAVREERA